MTTNEMLEKIATKAAEGGHTGDLTNYCGAMAGTFDLQYGDIPEVQALGLETNEEKTYYVLFTESPKTAGTDIDAASLESAVANLGATVAKKTSKPAATEDMPPEMKEHLSGVRKSIIEDIKADISLTKLVADKPKPTEIFKDTLLEVDGQKIHAFKVEDKAAMLEKLKKLQDDVVADEDERLEDGAEHSSVIFQKLLDLVENDKPIEFEVSDKYGKIIGAVLVVDGAEDPKNTEHLLQYMTFKTSGQLFASEGHPGAMVATRVVKGTKADAKNKTKGVLRFKNRPETEEFNNIVCASECKNEVDKYTVRSKLKFKVYAKDKDGKRKMTSPQKGEPKPILRTVSVTGKVNGLATVRKKDFEEEFKVIDADLVRKGYIAGSADAQEKLSQGHMAALQILAEQIRTDHPDYDTYKDIIAKVKAAPVAVGGSNATI